MNYQTFSTFLLWYHLHHGIHLSKKIIIKKCKKQSTNGNMLKCWLLLYINYTSILFLKEKEILSI